MRSFSTILGRAVHHYAHAFESRAFFFLEMFRAEKRGHKLPKGSYTKVLKQPSIIDDHLLLLRFIKPDDTLLLIDAGGNVGYWSEQFMQFFPNTEVMAFEPVKKSFEAYRVRFQSNRQVSVFHTALSDRTGTSEIQLGKDSRVSTLKGYADTQKDLQIEMIGTEKVELNVLDHYDIAPYRSRVSKVVLKVDVQGNELETLRGASNALKSVDIALIECSFAHQHPNESPSFAPISKLLLEYGLYPVVFRDYGRALGPYAWERDVIFVRESLITNLWGW